MDNVRNDSQNMQMDARNNWPQTRKPRLVKAVAARLVREFRELGATVDAETVAVGAALVDASKDDSPLAELSLEGDGEAFRAMSSVHAFRESTSANYRRWFSPEVTLEERTVYLAENLSKRKRDDILELAIINEIAQELGMAPSPIFRRLNGVFDEIESEGRQRVSCFMPE